MNKTEELNKTILCRIAPSPIKGVGVFALQDIGKGAVLQPYVEGDAMIELSEAEFAELVPQVRDLIRSYTLFRKDYPLLFINPNRLVLMQTFMNHADDANSDGITALRDIRAGEEVTENYMTLVGDPHDLTKEILTI